MSSDWPMKSVDQLKAAKKSAIAMGPFGSRIKVENFVSEGVPILKGGNLHGAYINDDKCDFLTEEKATELSSSVAVPGDIVITHRGTIGQVSIVPEDSRYPKYIVSQSQLKVSLNTSIINPLFANYYLRSRDGQHQLLSFSSQVGVPAIAKASSSVKQIRIPCPPLRVQKNIVIVLKTLDDKIQLNQQINQTLEQMAQAIFKSWFIDFDPVKAKTAALEAGGSEDDALLAAMQAIAGSALFATDAADADAPTQLARLQTEHPEQYATLRATAELFPSAMQESELGEIPEGWEAKPFGELLIKTIGGDWGKEEPDEKHTEKVKILRGTDLPHVYAGFDDKVPTRYVDPKKLATRKLENGDIVIEVSGGSPTQPTGRSLYLTQEIINRLNADLEPASFCRLFRPESKEAGLILGLHLQKIYGEGKTWLYQNTSTGISNFQTKMFLEKELIVLPPLEMQASFYTLVMPYLQKISSAENKVLAELRDVLLPKLLSGELSLAVAEEQLADTVDPAHV